MILDPKLSYVILLGGAKREVRLIDRYFMYSHIPAYIRMTTNSSLRPYSVATPLETIIPCGTSEAFDMKQQILQKR